MLPIKLCAVFTALFLNTVAVERYAKVWVGEDGRVSVMTTDGRLLRPANDNGQVGAERALVSADRESVGWLALYGFSSRPLPLKLVLLVSCP